MTKYCRDCRFMTMPPFVAHLRVREPLCLRGELNLVTGEPDENNSVCREMRYRGACGPDAKLFEPKTPEAA